MKRSNCMAESSRSAACVHSFGRTNRLGPSAAKRLVQNLGQSHTPMRFLRGGLCAQQVASIEQTYEDAQLPGGLSWLQIRPEPHSAHNQTQSHFLSLIVTSNLHHIPLQRSTSQPSITVAAATCDHSSVLPQGCAACLSVIAPASKTKLQPPVMTAMTVVLGTTLLLAVGDVSDCTCPI